MRKVLFILSELADSDLDWMVEVGVKQRYPAGAMLIREGKPIEVLFIVLDGTLGVTLAAMGDKRIAELRSGEILGELSFLDSRPPSASVTALNDATVLSIPRASLHAKLEQDMAFAVRFYRALGIFLSSRLRRTQQRLGYGGDKILDDDVEHEDELDPGLLNSVALAGARFDWLLRRLSSAASAGIAGTGGRGPGEVS